jgi:hypothetical protein
MALTLVVNGNQSSANDINQVINVLQQPSGGQEKGGYYLDSWSNAASDEVGYWINSLSKNVTPVSVSLDTSIDTTTFCNAPSTNHLNTYGFHVYTISNAAALKFYVGGIYTLQY